MKLSMLLLIVLPCRMFACSCIGGDIHVKKAIKESNFIIKGIIMGSEKIKVHPDLDTNMNIWMANYTVVVNGIFKGKIFSDTLKIITGLGNGDCGYRFERGKEYIIYAKWRKKFFDNDIYPNVHIYTDVCTRTTGQIEEEMHSLRSYRKLCVPAGSH